MKLFRDIGGAAAVEFALVGPILLLILAGTVDYGQYIVRSMQMASAVRTAVQHGLESEEVDTGALTKMVRDELADIGSLTVVPRLEDKCPDDIVLTRGTCPGYGKPQAFLTMSATAPYNTTFLPPLGAITRTATARLR